MQIDLLESAAANVVALINDTNTTALTEAELTLGTPTTFATPAENGDRNTGLTVTSKAGSGYTGAVDVRYNRLDISTYTAATEGLEYQLAEGDTLGDILSTVATALGVVEEAVELDIVEVPTVADGESVTINIAATTDSLLYVGQAAVTVFPSTTPLSSEIVTGDLNGFDQPA